MFFVQNLLERMLNFFRFFFPSSTSESVLVALADAHCCFVSLLNISFFFSNSNVFFTASNIVSFLSNVVLRYVDVVL